ncbi:MAG: 5-formyltetrahydrofolate cyclo-ligase [Eubacteriales bacterium]|nr:5-formyltetrahydrofolate cyclo-ligase [Eubacteriales bacterium]
MDKKSIRQKMIEKRNALEEKKRINLSNQIADIIVESEIYKKFNNICVYQSFRGEVLCDRIKEQAFLDHKCVYLPVTDKEAHSICFYQIDESTTYVQGAYGILEPVILPGHITLQEPALILMPGLVFDSMKHRIGYGGGYYDRFLEKNKKHETIALCYAFQVIDEILPYEKHDVLPDYIATEKGIF